MWMCLCSVNTYTPYIQAHSHHSGHWISSSITHSRFSMVYGAGCGETERGQDSLLEKGNATSSVDREQQRRCTAVGNRTRKILGLWKTWMFFHDGWENKNLMGSHSQQNPDAYQKKSLQKKIIPECENWVWHTAQREGKDASTLFYNYILSGRSLISLS